MYMHPQHISVSAKAAVIRNGEILLVRYDEPFLHYNLPGGRLFDGETLYECIHRKLWVECRAKVDIERLLFVYEHLPHPIAPEEDDYQKVQFTFLAWLQADSVPINPSWATDQDAVEWHPLENLRNLPLIPPVAPKLLATIHASPDIPNSLIPHDRAEEKLHEVVTRANSDSSASETHVEHQHLDGVS